jgi:hypothetical protein
MRGAPELLTSDPETGMKTGVAEIGMKLVL